MVVRHWCYYHICNDMNMFNFYEVIKGMNMYIGNYTSSSVIGKGEVELKFTFGKFAFL